MATLEELGIALVRAPNPGPFTLDGTNTWLVGRDPVYVIDPGPALAGHVDAVVAEVRSRGGLGGIALTHDHADHAEAVAAVRERTSATTASTWPASAGPGSIT